MRLTKFRVQDYRCIQDSGWVDIDDMAVIVGKNESGKTSLLKALWKLNPFHDASYNIDRDFPTGRRKEKSPDKTVVTARFVLSPEEITKLETINEPVKGVTEIEVRRNYKGTRFFSFLPQHPLNTERDIPWVVSQLDERIAEPPAGFTDHFKNLYRQAFKACREEMVAGGGSRRAVEICQKLRDRLPSFCHPSQPGHQQDLNGLQRFDHLLEETKKIVEQTPLRDAVDLVHGWLPTFVYMDDYRIFSGSAQLDEILERKGKNALQHEDETVILIMEMAGLTLEDEVTKGGDGDREQRILDMNDASQTLTNLIADRWSQKRYEVMFQADGQHFITLVRDVGQKALVALEERSKGFQWFFSFDMMLMHETRGKFENAVILLDEPGLHLHAAAQQDLLKRLKAYTAKNQLIYTTHLPFMIDFTRLDNIYICEEKGTEGIMVHKDWATADKDARFTLQAALGLSWSQSLFVSKYNLIIEGITDYWLLTTVSTMLKDSGQEGLDEQLVITPAGGANKVIYVGTLLQSQQLNVAVLLNSDKESDAAYNQLARQWMLKDKSVLRIGEMLGVTETRTLEDLFEESYYLKLTQSAYTKELVGKILTLKPSANAPLVERVSEALQQLGIPDFNKGRTAKRIMDDLARKKLSDLPGLTVERFKKVIAAINAIVAGWRKS